MTALMTLMHLSCSLGLPFLSWPGIAGRPLRLGRALLFAFPRDVTLGLVGTQLPASSSSSPATQPTGGPVQRNPRFCDGIQRRDFLRLGTAGLFGLGLSLPDLLRLQARAAEQGRRSNDVSLIFLFLHGGLSTLDTWDLKPQAPAEFRGEFRPIATNVPGIQITEHLPRTARQMDKFALIRSFRHHNSDHGRADHY